MKWDRPRGWVPLIRAVLILFGLVAVLVGAQALIPAVPRSSDKVTFLAWFLAPAVLSDALLMPLAAVLGWTAARWLPLWLRTPAVAGVILSTAMFAIALPFLGRPGLRPDNPSLLDRNYALGFAALLAVIWAGMLGWALLRRRGGDGPAERSRRPGAAFRQSTSGPPR